MTAPASPLNASEREHIRITRDELLSKVSTPRALIPHLVRAHAAARLSRGPQPDDSQTEYGSVVGVPGELR
jgi:hypothetical protein